jgi:hypothetical protein
MDLRSWGLPCLGQGSYFHKYSWSWPSLGW